MKRATSREPDEVKLLGLIGDIYRAAEDSSQWSTFLKHASATVGGRFSLILLQDRRTQALDFSLFEGADPEIIRLYTEHYAEQDFWLAHGPHLPSGTVVRGSDLFPLGSMPGTSFYEELMHPFEIEGMLGAIIAGSDALEQFAYLSIVQTRERDDFSEREVDSVRRADAPPPERVGDPEAASCGRPPAGTITPSTGSTPRWSDPLRERRANELLQPGRRAGVATL